MERTDFWETCWASEDPARLASFQDAWREGCGEISGLFRAHGVRTVCDAACGFGAYTMAFASKGFQVSAFDISPTAAEITKRGLEKYGLKADVKAASILSTGYADEAFDGVIASSVLDHMTVADAQKALSELYRITKPDGLILVSFDTPEDSDREMKHEILADGSLRYAEGTPRAGMVFHPYDGEEIKRFLEGKSVIYEHTNQKDEQIRILKKQP